VLSFEWRHKARPASLLAAPMRINNSSRAGQLCRMARSFHSSRASFFRRMAISLARRPSLLANTWSSPSSTNSFTSTESRTFCQDNASHFFSHFRILPRRVLLPRAARLGRPGKPGLKTQNQVTLRVSPALPGRADERSPAFMASGCGTAGLPCEYANGVGAHGRRHGSVRLETGNPPAAAVTDAMQP